VNYVIESRIHPPSDLIAGLYTKDSLGGTVGGGIPIRRSSVEIISSYNWNIYSRIDPHSHAGGAFDNPVAVTYNLFDLRFNSCRTPATEYVNRFRG